MSRVGIGIRPPKKRPLGIVDVNVLYHTLSEPARAEYGGAPFHTHPMPECHKRAADLAGHRPAVTFSGQHLAGKATGNTLPWRIAGCVSQW